MTVIAKEYLIQPKEFSPPKESPQLADDRRAGNASTKTRQYWEGIRQEHDSQNQEQQARANGKPGY